MNLCEYIEENLPKCIRENVENKADLIGLPYPYVVPCASGRFQEMFYWDTYFTNRGFLVRGDIEQARNNIDNMCYLIDKYGFVPNASHTYFLYSSQPPVMSLMVSELYAVTKDKQWLSYAYDALVKEHGYWTEYRQSVNGLNRYDGTVYDHGKARHDNGLVRNPNELRKRIGMSVTIEKDEDSVRGLLSAGESGWDLNPRMGVYGYHYTPADLNSLLYALEANLMFFAKELGKEEEAGHWDRLRRKRSTACRRYLKNEDGLFMDYNTVTKKKNEIVSVACFYPLFCGMADEEEAKAAKNALARLETEYGILTCEQNETPGNYQWDYPNGWAPMQLIVVDSLLKYGYKEDAIRNAKKFVKLVEDCYEQTGHLWEKYNVVEGNVNVADEYEMPAMLGWTFGVYTYFNSLLK